MRTCECGVAPLGWGGRAAASVCICVDAVKLAVIPWRFLTVTSGCILSVQFGPASMEMRMYSGQTWRISVPIFPIVPFER